MGTIGWRREPITAAAIQASALASKARLCPTCQTCNPTCRSLQPHLQPHLPEPLHPYAAERAHPMSICYCVRCWVPSGQSRPNPSPNPNPNQVLGTKWTWAKIAGLAFNENGALKTSLPHRDLTLTLTLTLTRCAQDAVGRGQVGPRAQAAQGPRAVRAAEGVPLGRLWRRGAPPELQCGPRVVRVQPRRRRRDCARRAGPLRATARA